MVYIVCLMFYSFQADVALKLAGVEARNQMQALAGFPKRVCEGWCHTPISLLTAGAVACPRLQKVLLGQFGSFNCREEEVEGLCLLLFQPEFGGSGLAPEFFSWPLSFVFSFSSFVSCWGMEWGRLGGHQSQAGAENYIYIFIFTSISVFIFIFNYVSVSRIGYGTMK